MKEIAEFISRIQKTKFDLHVENNPDIGQNSD